MHRHRCVGSIPHLGVPRPVGAGPVSNPVAIGTPEQRSRDAHALIYLTVVAIEDFRDVNGQLPRTLDQIGEDDPEMLYTFVQGGYRIEMTIGEFTVDYELGKDLTPFREALGRAAR